MPTIRMQTNDPFPAEHPDDVPGAGALERRLTILRRLAWADLLLLALLLASSALDARSWVSILGPLHGGNFLLLVVVACTGASDRLWPWWFPGIVLATAGPPGALIGEHLVRRRLRAGPAVANAAEPRP